MAQSPIKTQILDLISARVDDIALINSVVRQAALPRLWESVTKPVAFLYDDDETSAEQRNRIRRAQFTLYMYIKVRNENGRSVISDQLDILHADAYQKLIADCGSALKAYGVRIQEGSPVASKYFDDEYMGAIMLVYTVTYNTNCDSLYTTNTTLGANLNP